jgi:hypothetical protein
MRFGRKAGVITPTGTGTSGGDWPKGLRPGETRVRFIQEIPEWIEYWEHFDQSVKFFPCTGDKQTCPGCTSADERTQKASKRYLAPVLDPKTGRIYGLKLPTDLANRLSLRNDRNGGTVTNRDYTLIRTGTGLDTEYDVEQEEKVAIDLAVYEDQVGDLNDLLTSQFSAAWPDFDPDGRADGAPRKRRTMTHEEKVNTSGDDEPPPFEAPAAKAAPAPRRRRKVVEPEPEPEPEPPAAEAEPAPAEDDTEMIELTEDELRAMPRQQLVSLARQAQVPVTLTMSRDQIIDVLMENFS